MRNNNGPKTLPCGTPDTTLTSLLLQPSTITCCDRFDRSCVNIDNTEPPIPTEQSLYRIPWWLTLSKAVLKSERCCLFWHSFSLVGHSRSWWMVVVANWLTCDRGGSLKCFWPAVVPLVHCRAFLYSGKQALWLCWRLYSGGCCAIPWWEGSRFRVYESWSKQG